MPSEWPFLVKMPLEKDLSMSPLSQVSLCKEWPPVVQVVSSLGTCMTWPIYFLFLP
jgi:hypothetical protein